MSFISQLKTTILDRLISGNHATLLKFLVKYVFNIDWIAILKKEYLPRATSKKHTKMVDLLLTHGAPVNSTDSNGFTALHIAAYRGYTEIVKLLLKHKTQVDLTNVTALHMAAHRGHTEIVKLLLDKRAQVDLTTNGGTALLSAVLENHPKIVELLLTHGAPVNSTNSNGFTALHIAAYRGYTEIVKLLLTHGAPVNSTDSNGLTALHMVAYRGYTEIVKLLLTHGAPVNSTDSNGFTALHMAAYRDHTEMVQLLLRHKTQVDYLTYSLGFTALHIAVSQGHTKIAELLILASLSKNLTIEKPGYLQNNEELSRFWDQTVEEANQLSSHLSEKGIYISLDKFLYHNPTQLVELFPLGTIDKLAQVMAKPEFKETFPNFSPLLEKLEACLKDRIKSLALADHLILASNDKQKDRPIYLNLEVQRKVYQHLSTSDLKGLLKASLFPLVSESKPQAFNQDRLTARIFSRIPSFSVQ